MIGLTWLVMGGCTLFLMLAGAALCWQVLHRYEALAALQGCQIQLKKQQAMVYQQASDIRELTAGWRAEKAHVEQLQRKMELANYQDDHL